MACNIIYKGDGKTIDKVVTNEGKDSTLFPQLLNLSKNKPETAKTLYAVTELPEFKSWFKDSRYVNNIGEPMLVKGEFYQNNEGETWWAKSTDKKNGLDKYPFGVNRIAGLTPSQVDDISNLTYGMLITNVDSVEDISGIEQKLIKNMWMQLEKVFEKQDYHRHSIIKIVLEDLLNNSIPGRPISRDSRLLDNIKTKLKSAGIYSKDIETDEQDKTQTLNLKGKELFSPKENAALSTKLLLEGLREITREGKSISDKTLGAPKYVPFTQVYNLLTQELTGIVSDKNTEDVYEAYIAKLRTLVKFHPFIKELIQKLEVGTTNSPTSEQRKTRFMQAFSLEAQPYSQTIYSGEEGKRLFKIGKADVQAKEEVVREKWQEGFKAKLTTYSKTGKHLLQDRLATAASKSFNNLLREYRKAAKGNVNAYPTQYIAQLASILESVGIDISTDALQYHIIDIEQGETMADRVLDTFGHLEFIFGKQGLPNLVGRYGKKQDAERGQRPIEDELGEVVNLYKNEKGLLVLAKSQARFELGFHENSVLGPNGDTYWPFSDISYLSQVISQFKQGDLSYLEQLQGQAFSKNSKWVNYLLEDKKNRDLFDKVVFMQMKDENSYQGIKYFNLSEPDQLADRINRSMKGHLFLMTPGNARTLYNVVGTPQYSSGLNISSVNGETSFDYASSEVLNTFKNYIKDELSAMEVAYNQVFGENKLPKNKQNLFYHYDKNDNERDSNGAPAGNAFKHYLFPELTFGSEWLAKNGIKMYTNQGKPLPLAKIDLNDPRIEALVKESFQNRVMEQIATAEEYGIVGKVTEKKTGQDFYTNKHLDVKMLEESEMYKNVPTQLKTSRAIADYVYNGIIANVESTKLFVGNVAFYKSIEDFPKRSNLYSTGISPLRIYRNKESNKYEVNPLYLQATAYDVFKPSEYLSKIEGYKKGIDLADGTTWVTPTLRKQRMKGLGEWNLKVEEAFNRLMAGELNIKDVVMLMPQKSVARGTEVKNNLNVPYREKTAEVILWPGLVNTIQLKDLYDNMVELEREWARENNGQEIGMAVSVESAIKVGAGQRTKIDDDFGSVLEANDIILEPIEKSHSLYGKQQEVNPKGVKEGTLGSQMKMLMLGDINSKIKIGNRSAVEWLKEAQDLENTISDLGKVEFFKRFGISEELGEYVIDEDIFRGELIRVFEEDQFRDEELIAGLQKGLEFDAIFQSRRKVMNKLANTLTKSTVTYKARGVQAVQISSFGFLENIQSSRDLSTGAESKIRWLRDGSTPLSGPRVVNGKLELAEILLPYKVVESIPGWETMSNAELKAAIGEDVLSVIGYRIPTQSLASIDALQIVGILPPEVGDTVVVYEDITAKTGSDFDIDKLFMLLPHVKYSKETGKLELIDPNGTSKQSLDNKRILLYKELFKSVEEYPRIIKSIDTEDLKTDADTLAKMAGEEDVFDALKLFSPQFQQEVKRRFSLGAVGVGAIANAIIDNVVSQIGKLNISYIGMGSTVTLPDGTVATSLHETSRKDGLLVSEIQSGYMNAFVDIEKDPYIAALNVNKETLNIATLLVRAQVPTKWINRFLKQPAVVEYVKQSMITQSPILDRKFYKTEEIKRISAKYSSTEATKFAGMLAEDVGNIAKVLTIKNLEKGITGEDMSYQVAVIEYFDMIHNKGKQIFAQNLASKVHTQGVGQDTIQARMAVQVRDEIATSDEYVEIGNFNEKFAEGTVLGKFFENGPELFLDLFNDKFLSGRLEDNELAMLEATDNKNSKDYRLRRGIEDRMYSYMYSNHFVGTPELGNAESLLFDSATNRSLVQDFVIMSENYPESVLLGKNKGILRSKVYRNAEGINTMPSMIFMSNAKFLPPDSKKLATQEWEDGLNSDNPAEKAFYQKLVKYSYITSGFRGGLKAFHTLIPIMWNVESNFNGSVQELNLTQGDILHAGIDQVIRHEYKNSKYAPRLNRKSVTALSKKKGYRDGFKLFGKDAKKHVTTRFVTLNMGITPTNPTGEILLFKNGGYEIVEKSGEQYLNPIFYPISPLGLELEGGFRVTEYQFDKEEPKTMIEQNKVVASKETMKIVNAAYEFEATNAVIQEFTKPECI
tara:strand:- start:4513 stop:10749 length:6237 start_codon:yes stop_codon:yes gene_type:complete